MRCPLPILTLGVLLFTLTPRSAVADPFTVDHALTIVFASPGYAAAVNALFLEIGPLQVLEPVRGFTASLYDGARLLGANSLHLFDGYVGPLHLGVSNVWTAPGAPELNQAFRQTTVDFRPITNGTIDGRVIFTIGAGAITFEPANVKLHASQILPGGSGIPAIPPTLLDVDVTPSAVPEPGTLLLMLGGAAAAAVRRRRGEANR
jgi:hypothetical protein